MLAIASSAFVGFLLLVVGIAANPDTFTFYGFSGTTVKLAIPFVALLIVSVVAVFQVWTPRPVRSIRGLRVFFATCTFTAVVGGSIPAGISVFWFETFSYSTSGAVGAAATVTAVFCGILAYLSEMKYYEIYKETFENL